MITEAIGALKERNGSSRQAIAKYIAKQYPNVLPPNHSALLTAHLRLLKISGHLLMFKHSYLLPGSVVPVSSGIATATATPAASGIMKRAGHPSKYKVEVQPNGGFGSQAQQSNVDVNSEFNQPSDEFQVEQPDMEISPEVQVHPNGGVGGTQSVVVPNGGFGSQAHQSNVDVNSDFNQPSDEFQVEQPDMEISPEVQVHPNGGVGGTQSVVVSLGLVDEPQETKRGRGRPPWVKSNSGPLVVAESGGVSLGKRGRGRPARPKVFPSVDNAVANVTVNVPVSNGGLTRGRGRPPRSGTPSVGVGAGSVAKARGRPRRIGRPPKNIAVGGGVGVGVGGVLPVKRRGRPRKLGGKPVGCPRKNVYAGVGGVTYVPIESIDAAGGVLLAKRRGRGRLPNIAGAKKPRKLSGRPVGRPKKDASVTAGQALLAQQLTAYQDLKSKLEHIQSRTKQAVLVVKPYFNYENAPVDAVRALQELEELARVDAIAHPLNVLQGAQEPPLQQN